MKGIHVNVHTLSETAETLLPFGTKKKLYVFSCRAWKFDKKNIVIGYFMLCGILWLKMYWN